MTEDNFVAFQRLVKAYRPRFMAIARITEDEYIADDIEDEAWLIAP